MEVDVSETAQVKLTCETCKDGDEAVYAFDLEGGEEYTINGKTYPIRTDYKAHYEYSHLGDWKETHFCLGCKHEFTIEVCSY